MQSGASDPYILLQKHKICFCFFGFYINAGSSVSFWKYSLCNEPLIELSNPGASGSLFYVSSDDEFIIKTVQHKEAEFLQKLLPGYFMVSVDRVGGGSLFRMSDYYCNNSQVRGGFSSNFSV